MIKGVQLLIGKMEAEFSMAIRRHIYSELQDFVQITLRDPLYKAIKNKKDMLSGYASYMHFLDSIAYTYVF
jgi:cytoplasmic FMR1 interacting protein